MKIRPIRIEGDVAYVTLTHGYVAVIDAADVSLVEGFNWYAFCHYRADGALRTVYALRKTSLRDGPRRTALLHRQLMQPPDYMQIDHIDGDGLNNRRENMRIVTHQQNQQNTRISCKNTSGVKGVCWDIGKNKWRAKISIGGKQKYLGLFTCIQAAAAAYAAASEKHHGKFGRLE